MKKPAKKKPAKRYRETVGGKIITKDQAEANPREAVAETRERVLWRGWVTERKGRAIIDDCDMISKRRKDLWLTDDETAVRVRIVLEEK